MGKARRLKIERRDGTQGGAVANVASRDDQGRGTPLVDPAQVLLVMAIGYWIGAHLLTDFAGTLTALYALTALALGWVNPLAGAIVAIALVPFTGGAIGNDVGEIVRGVPMWGAAARLLVDRLRGAASPEAPGRLPTAAALIAVLLYPTTVFTAQALGHFADGEFPMQLAQITGGGALMYAAWIVFTHIDRVALDRVIGVLPFTLGIALACALAAWVGVPLIDQFAFKAQTFGRLAALGFPTPTAMGIAISLPLAFGAAYVRSRRAAALIAAGAIVAIILTESRGPLLAVIGGAAIAALASRRIALRWFAIGVPAGAIAIVALVVNRYGRRLADIAQGDFSNFKGDAMRVTSWFAGIETAVASPIVGGGAFSVAFWHNGELAKGGVNLSHNIVLQPLADGGIPLGLAVATVIAFSAAGAWRLRHSLRPEWIAAVATLLICGLWDMPQLRAYGALFGGLALALGARRTKDSTTEAAANE